MPSLVRALVLAVVVLAGPPPAHTGTTAGPPDPTPNPDSVVLTETLRATVLTDRLVRIEYSANRTWEDKPTFAFVNRNLPRPPFTVTRAGPHNATIKTAHLTIELSDPAAPPPPPPPPPPGAECTLHIGQDLLCHPDCAASRLPAPAGPRNASECCRACAANPACTGWVVEATTAADRGECFLIAHAVGLKPAMKRISGGSLVAPAGLGPDSVRITLAAGPGGAATTWRPGMPNTGNLLGTLQGLDGTTGAVPMDCIAGGNRSGAASEMCVLAPISRDGWAVYDDSQDDIVDPASGWIAPRGSQPTSTADIYFFGHGTDYRAALGDFARVAGAPRVPPRFTLGVWWSRYWPYTSEELTDLAGEYAGHSMPLDVLVSDMAWHYHNRSKVAWGGYSWSPQLFPEPGQLFAWLDANRVNLTLNLHLNPVEPDEANYRWFATALGFPASFNASIPSAASAPYTQSVMELLYASKPFAEAYLDLLDRMGTNWWWLDDNPRWVARILYEHSERRMETGLAFSRWGGLGSHRYPIGFSGDTYTEWSTLAFQVVFTVKSSNVLFYWSHDIGGHRTHHDAASLDPELYLRWLQFGAFAPILRTHPQPDAHFERRAWAYPLPFSSYMENAFRLRGQLVPLLYSALLDFADTGVSPLRPPYYDHPALDAAYAHNDTYLFGDNLFVAPIVAPQDPGTWLATRSFWLPPGGWVDLSTGATVQAGPAGQTLTVDRTLWETNAFARAGSVLPLAPRRVGAWFGGAAETAGPLVFQIWPGGAAAGNVTLREEASGAEVRASYVLAGASLSVTITRTAAADGLALQARGFAVQLQQSPPAVAATGAATGFVYSARELQTELTIPATTAASVECGATFAFPATDNPLLQTDFVGKRRRLHRFKAYLDNDLLQPHQAASGLYVAVNVPARLAARPGDYKALLGPAFDATARAAQDLILASPAVNTTLKHILTSWLE